MWKDDYFTGEFIDPYLILATESVDLDSSMFNQWIYLPFEKDGETEFLEPGFLYYAGVEYNNWHEDEMVRKYKGLSIGATNRSPANDVRSMYIYPKALEDHPFAWGSSYRNLMVRMIINDHSSTFKQDEPFVRLFSLDQNYPNPFAEETNITYTLTRPTQIDIVIRDITGKTVMVVNEGMRSIGKHSVQLKAKELGVGLYTYTVIAGDFQKTKQMVISK